MLGHGMPTSSFKLGQDASTLTSTLEQDVFAPKHMLGQGRVCAQSHVMLGRVRPQPHI